MPIEKAEWEDGRRSDTLKGKIMIFLRENKGQAFTQVEIAKAVGHKIDVSDLWTLIGSIANSSIINSALEGLIEEGKVEVRIIDTPSGDQTYYMAV